MKKHNDSESVNTISCGDYKKISDAEYADILIEKVMKQLKNWKKNKYDRNSHYVSELTGNLQKIDVLFSRDIKKI